MRPHTAVRAVMSLPGKWYAWSLTREDTTVGEFSAIGGRGAPSAEAGHLREHPTRCQSGV